MSVPQVNKVAYVTLMTDLKMSSGIHDQLAAFLEGLHDLIPAALLRYPPLFPHSDPLGIIACGISLEPFFRCNRIISRNSFLTNMRTLRACCRSMYGWTLRLMLAPVDITLDVGSGWMLRLILAPPPTSVRLSGWQAI